MEKYLRIIGFIIDVEPTKDSKDMGRRSQIAVNKVKEKETSEIETITRLLKFLKNKVEELKRRIIETTMSSRPPILAKRKNMTSGSSSGHPTKSAQSSNVFFPSGIVYEG